MRWEKGEGRDVEYVSGSDRADFKGALEDEWDRIREDLESESGVTKKGRHAVCEIPSELTKATELGNDGGVEKCA